MPERTSAALGALARSVVATMFGGPIVGGQTAINEATNLLVRWLGAERNPTYESMLLEIGRGLEQLARSERIGDDQLEQAMAQARSVVLGHGLSAAEIVTHDLNPDRVAAEVLSRAAPALRELDEPARELCRRAIGTVYGIALSRPNAVPELKRAFEQAVLTRLTELRGQPREIRLALRGAVAAAAVADRRERWRPDMYSHNALLRAEFEIVPFYGREEVLTELRTWAGSDDAVGVRLYTGAGGTGKTRLMIELCGQLGRDGWRAGFLNRALSQDAWLLPLDAIFEDDQPLFIVVDYAEMRVSEVVALMQRARNRASGGAVRVALLSRALGDWWTILQSTGGGIGDILAGPATDVVALPPLASDVAERQRLFESAAAAFRRAVPGSRAPKVPALEAEEYDLALYVLVAALAAVQGEAVETEKNPLDWALRREQAFLNDGIEALGFGQLRGRPILQCAAVATLAGRATDRDEARRLLSSSAPLLGGLPFVVIDAAAELLHRLYPGSTWLQGVLPDVLGEHLVQRAMDEDPGLLGAVLGPS